MNESDKFKFLPPPPPPPPPPLLPMQTFKQSPKILNKSDSRQDPENELDSCLKIILSDKMNFSEVFFVSNTYLEPQLQDGPKCGLVALSIATSASKKNFVSVHDIFQAALSLGFTKQGEMFSADWLASLAEKCCGFRVRVIKGNLNVHLQCIIHSLLRDCLLLVPYDADFNHSPCCKRGTKAHWAVISGFAIIEQNKTDTSQDDDHSVVLKSPSGLCGCVDSNSDTDSPLIISAREGRTLIAKRTARQIRNDFREGKVYLIGRQGKSKHYGLWPFDDMADSNDNLVSVSADRSPELYLLPQDGVLEGLKGKAIILERAV